MMHQNLDIVHRLYLWTNKNSINWLWICLSVLVACHSKPNLSAVQPSPFQVRLESYTSCEEYDGGFDSVIENRSGDTIELLGLCYFSFYDMRTVGWVEHELVRGRSAGSYCYDSITIAPGESFALTPNQSRIRGCGAYMLRVPYRIQTSTVEMATPVYQIYSNVFSIGSAQVNVTSFSEINWHLPAPQVTFVNKSKSGSNWIVPLCAREIAEWTSTFDMPGWYPYAFLERMTDWGTWESIPPAVGTCTGDFGPVEIPPQSTKVIDLWEGGRFDLSTLAPGLYRWYMIYYGTKPGTGGLGAIYHTFSAIFEIDE